jgi:DHA1 family tetracycline resistance protein-like MFS transporter
MSKPNKSPLFIIFITVFIDLVGFGMIIPLSPYFAQNFGANSLEVGLLMAIYSGFQFVFSPFWGRLSDRIGRRPVLLVSLMGAAISHLLFGLAGSLTVLFVARAFAGLFGANISTAMAYIADITGHKERSKGMGLIGAAFGLGFVFGPALGGIIASYSPEAVAYTASAICFLNFVWAYFKLKESRTGNSEMKRPSRLTSFLNGFKKPVVSNLLLISFCSSFAMSAMEVSLFLYVKDLLGWSLQTASFGFAYVGIAMAFNQGFLVRRLLPKFGEPVLLLVGMLVFAVSLGLTAMPPTVLSLAIAMTLLALGVGFVNPAINGSISQLTSSDEQGETLGVVQSLSALARILGPPLGGWLYAYYSPHAPFAFASGIGFVGFFLVLAQFKKLPSGAKISQTSSRKVAVLGEIGLFQLRNLIQVGAPYLFMQIGESKVAAAEELSILLRNREIVGAANAKAWLESKSASLQQPILLICENGSQSKKIASLLETAGYINVYLVAGGILGLNQELAEEK